MIILYMHVHQTLSLRRLQPLRSSESHVRVARPGLEDASSPKCSIKLLENNFSISSYVRLFSLHLFQRYTFIASRGCDSPGQYGHLNREPLLTFSSESLQITWPHGIIIGGFSSVACSLLTGHTKMEWKW